jgi:hypothetical protein
MSNKLTIDVHYPSKTVKLSRDVVGLHELQEIIDKLTAAQSHFLTNEAFGEPVFKGDEK